MSRFLTFTGVAAVICLAGSAAIAKEYQDYTPQKGVWSINAIEVDPNHVDEYLTGLRTSQVPAFEVMKKHGIIDAYRFVVRNGYSKGSPNVLIQVHFTSMAVLEPDQARDQMIEKEMLATFSEEQGKAAVAGYEKYRQFIDDGLWTEVTMAK
ncbi:MAG: hypothetical protein ABS87_12940 [Sphingomonas sp. SCN 67-18]|uniref:hypothetical protein n=1 Tax=uncultured Sphingomonas sp. TaxID=158754 RepID=UPI00086EBB61|nr:hypothetical protein [Sphingomonas sp. SCN 67-18]ODU19882.1 MAG: hypothetical protein ABS87_12940 [Sphingomonas sp. SCN 67-18]